MQIGAHETTNISMATALLCSEYVVLDGEGGAEERADATPITIVNTVPVVLQPGRKPICRFVVGCADSKLLYEKVGLYKEKRLVVRGETYDVFKKRVVDEIRKTRGKD